MNTEVLIYAIRDLRIKAIKETLTKEEIKCTITDSLDVYIKELKKDEVVITVIDHKLFSKKNKNFKQLYELLSFKEIMTRIIIGSQKDKIERFLEVDAFYPANFKSEEVISDVMMYYESAKLLSLMEDRSDSLVKKDHLEEGISRDLSVKDRKISSLYVQLTEFQNKIKKLYENWECLNIPLKIKKIQDFHNQFKLMIVEQKQDWEEFHEHFVLIHPNFFREIQTNYKNLTEENVRMCAYIKMGMSNNEIAAYLNILPNSVKRTQNRIKHKLNITGKNTLRTFIRDIG